MDRQKIVDKIKDIIKSVELEKECLRLFESGAVNGDELGVEKAIIHVALLNEADQYRPLSKEGRALSNNLMHF